MVLMFVPTTWNPWMTSVLVTWKVTVLPAGTRIGSFVPGVNWNRHALTYTW
jgi:hypothetical protein